MAINSKDNPRGMYNPPFNRPDNRICSVCHRVDHRTKSNYNKHRCTGPWFEHPDYEEICKYRNRLWHRAQKRGDECLLTAKQISDLFDEAGITMADIGQKADEYHLARYNDTGNYEWGNCRYILSVDNVREMNAPNTCACVVDGVEYATYKAAAKVIGCKYETVSRRCNSTNPKWDNYMRKQS